MYKIPVFLLGEYMYWRWRRRQPESFLIVYSSRKVIAGDRLQTPTAHSYRGNISMPPSSTARAALTYVKSRTACRRLDKAIRVAEGIEGTPDRWCASWETRRRRSWKSRAKRSANDDSSYLIESSFWGRSTLYAGPTTLQCQGNLLFRGNPRGGVAKESLEKGLPRFLIISPTSGSATSI